MRLVQSLDLRSATFYGCSSAGNIALFLAANHAQLARKVVVHEVADPPKASDAPPSGTPPDISTNPILRLTTLTDQEIVVACKDLFRNSMNGNNPSAWDALGEDYHRRLERNYVTWVRRYLSLAPGPTAPTIAQLRGLPITWTVGALSETAATIGNIYSASATGIQVGLLNSKHFPQVSIPEQLAGHIANVASA